MRVVGVVGVGPLPLARHGEENCVLRLEWQLLVRPFERSHQV